jgi:lipopolysaccharide exporter
MTASTESTADTYVRMVSLMALLTLPAGTGISLVADPLVRLALGPLWIHSVPIV